MKALFPHAKITSNGIKARSSGNKRNAHGNDKPADIVFGDLELFASLLADYWASDSARVLHMLSLAWAKEPVLSIIPTWTVHCNFFCHALLGGSTDGT